MDLLGKEGIVSGAREGLQVELSGDLMLDTARHFGGQPKPVALSDRGLGVRGSIPTLVDYAARNVKCYLTDYLTDRNTLDSHSVTCTSAIFAWWKVRGGNFAQPPEGGKAGSSLGSLS